MAQRIFRDLIAFGHHKGKPKCIVEGCNQPGQNTGNRRKDGSVVYRAQCSGHHSHRYGMDGSYRIHKKDFCENVDGRLGFFCTTNVLDACMLDVDHINNNHDDNRPTNLQTLCSCCHNYKTKYFSKYTGLQYLKKLFEKNSLKLSSKTKVKV